MKGIYPVTRRNYVNEYFEKRTLFGFSSLEEVVDDIMNNNTYNPFTREEIEQEVFEEHKYALNAQKDFPLDGVRALPFLKNLFFSYEKAHGFPGMVHQCLRLFEDPGQREKAHCSGHNDELSYWSISTTSSEDDGGFSDFTAKCWIGIDYEKYRTGEEVVTLVKIDGETCGGHWYELEIIPKKGIIEVHGDFGGEHFWPELLNAIEKCNEGHLKILTPWSDEGFPLETMKSMIVSYIQNEADGREVLAAFRSLRLELEEESNSHQQNNNARSKYINPFK